MSNHENGHGNQCWTRRRKDGSRYVTCEGGEGEQPEDQSDLDLCGRIENPLLRDACRTIKELPDRMRQALEDWIAPQPPDLPKPTDLAYCNRIKDPLLRDACRTMNVLPDLMRQAQEDMRKAQEDMRRQDLEDWINLQPERFRQPPDLSKPPVYGWEDVDKNIETTLQDSWPFWVYRVKEDGAWDFKNSRESQLVHGKVPPWEKRERAGNINYGATCVAVGHDPETCLWAGGIIQGLSDVKNKHEPFYESPGRPWDSGANSCYGEPSDDCQQVIEGIRYGLDYLRRKGQRP